MRCGLYTLNAKTGQAFFTDWMSFLPSQHMEEINPNPETLRAGISKASHQDRIAEKAKMIYK